MNAPQEIRTELDVEDVTPTPPEQPPAWLELLRQWLRRFGWNV